MLLLTVSARVCRSVVAATRAMNTKSEVSAFDRRKQWFDGEGRWNAIGSRQQGVKGEKYPFNSIECGRMRKCGGDHSGRGS